MINAILALLSVLLWGGAYGWYFWPDIRRAWRHRGARRHLPMPRPMGQATAFRRPPPMRPRYNVPPLPPLPPIPVRAATPEPRPAAPAKPDNVIRFPGRPKTEA